MRTGAGVGQEREEAGEGLVSNGRVLLAYSLAAALSAVVVGNSVDVSRANPVHLVSYNPAEDFVVLSLKNSSTIPARTPQETLSSGYDVASNPNDTLGFERKIVSGGFTEIISAKAACHAGGSFKACPGFMDLLGDKEQVLPRLRDVTVADALAPAMRVASLGEHASPSRRITASIEGIKTAVDALSIERAPIGRKVADALVSQAACMTGAMFDACAGFTDVLHTRQQAWPLLARASSPAREPSRTAGLSNVIVASASEQVSLATESVVTAFDHPAIKAGEVIIGTASTYNPYDRNDRDAGGAETASGELYNPIAWTAAIQIKLRGKFAGVRYGRLYKPSFALVELNGKRAIVKINDVGPLRPGRVIDLSTQAMHYFDPTLRRGLLDGMLVTPLVGTDWTPGPLGTVPMVAVASSGP